MKRKKRENTIKGLGRDGVYVVGEMRIMGRLTKTKDVWESCMEALINMEAHQDSEGRKLKE